MKRLLVFLTLQAIVFSLYSQEVKLNNAGHIMTPDRELENKVCSLVENEPTITVDNMQFKGNGIYKINNGYLAVKGYEEAIPLVDMRFYDQNGVEKNKISFKRVYNIQFSPDRSKIIFFDARNLVVLDVTDYSMNTYPGSAVFGVDNSGNPMYYDEENQNIVIGETKLSFTNQPLEIMSYNNAPYIFTRNKIFRIEKDSLKFEKKLDGTFFEAKGYQDELFFVSKKTTEKSYTFSMFKLDGNGSKYRLADTSVSQREIATLPKSEKEHEKIQPPLKYGEEYKHPIANSYGNMQDYDGEPYPHPGVDFLGEDNEKVYAVRDGYVKAVLTIGGAKYWRVAIGNKESSDKCEGYLYAHLVESSITVSEGDYVEAGEVIGELVPWDYYDLTHIHFARIVSEGSIWDGAWWTTDSPFIDIKGMIDKTPPVFDNAVDDDLFAFKDNNGNYLDPDNLSGDIQILSHVYDETNSNWDLDVYKLEYKIYKPGNKENPVVDKTSFAYDFMCDTYLKNPSHDPMVLKTLYSRDKKCYTVANYKQREYYQILTHTSGTEEINQGDDDIMLSTTDFANGEYVLSVTATDPVMNTTTETMTINFNNESTNIDQNAFANLDLYPNPFNDHIYMKNKENVSGSVTINTIGGQKVLMKDLQEAKQINTSHLQKGIYLINVKLENGAKNTFKFVKI